MEHIPSPFVREDLKEAIRQFHLLIRHIEMEKKIRLLRNRRRIMRTRRKVIDIK